MAYLNRISVIGNIGKDLELKTYANSGDKVGKTSIAVTKRFTKSDGTKGERTTWLNLDFPDHLVENAQKWITKGKSVYIEGELEIREYEDNGVKKTYTSIRVEGYQLLDKAPKEDKAEDAA